MSKKQKKNEIIKSFKIVIILLAATLMGSLFYIYKMSDRSKEMIVSLREQKATILKDLEKSKLFLDQASSTNSSLSQKLAAEHSKVSALISELKSKNVSQKDITVYQKGVDDIDSRIKVLLGEITQYKKQIDSTNAVLVKERSRNGALLTTNKTLVKKANEVAKVNTENNKQLYTEASKLYFYDLHTGTFRLKSSGKELQTDKASKVDVIKVSFSIGENTVIKPSNKEFYIQIIDIKNNIVGTKKTIKFGNDILDYSALLKTKYENKAMTLEELVPASNLNEGIYTVNVFDKSKLVLSSSLTLK